MTLITRKYNYYTISFESNGGSEIESATLKAGKQLIEPANPQKFGYNFGGWFADSRCTQEYTFLRMPWEDITVYAKWEIKPGYEWYISNTSADEFEISTENELKAFSEIVAYGEDFSGKNICLKNNITLENELLPIGDITNKFNGNFKGNAKTIENLTINAENSDYQGMFGAIGANSVIEDIKISNLYIKGKNNVGAIAGNSEGLIINCLVDGTVDGSQKYWRVCGS